MAFWTRWTPLEEDIFWLAGKALAFGERVSSEVYRAGVDTVFDVLDAVFPPLSASASLFSAQDDIVESLASSSSFLEHHDSVCCEETLEYQGSQDSHDDFADLAPESVCPTSSLACSVPLSASLFSEEESALVSSPQQQQQAFIEEATALPGPSQAPQFSAVSVLPSQDEVISPLKDQETSSKVLVSDALLCEQGLCGVRKETFFEAVLVQEAEKGASQAISLTSEGEGCLFELLDGGCLYQILRHLDSPSLIASSLVCRLWSEVSSAARHTLSLKTCNHVSQLPVTLKRFPNLQTVKVVGTACYLFDDRSLRRLGQQAKRLQHLEMEGSEKITDAGIAAVLRGCPELCTLTISFNDDPSHKAQCVKLSGVAFEGLRCKLTHVRLEACSGFTNKGLKALAAACPQLLRFTLKRQWQDPSLASGLEDVARLCPGLSRVTLHRRGAMDSSLRSFAASCPKLVSFSISCEDDVTDAGVAALLDHLLNLRQVSLFNNRKLRVIPRKKAGVPLRDLGLGGWLHLSDSNLQELGKERSWQELHFRNCPALTDATILKVLNNCRQLRRLVIRECPLVTPEILKSYSNTGSEARIKIDKCDGIPVGALLEELQLSDRIGVS